MITHWIITCFIDKITHEGRKMGMVSSHFIIIKAFFPMKISFHMVQVSFLPYWYMSLMWL